ncbi:MAG: glycosyl transferase family 1, partial [Treponemataceae bacterium]|nr:glycosyl transferase family 1 [Treponemataceae bacterium]
DVAFEGIEDNAVRSLFHKADSASAFARILNSWNSVSAFEKQAASDEFCARYNSCRFPDTIPG